MKFSIDTEAKTLELGQPLSLKEINYLFSLLRIDDLDDWKIDIPKYYMDPPTIQPFQIYNDDSGGTSDWYRSATLTLDNNTNFNYQ